MEESSPLWKRLVWMAVIWTGSVGALAVVAGLLEFWIRAGR